MAIELQQDGTRRLHCPVPRPLRRSLIRESIPLLVASVLLHGILLWLLPSIKDAPPAPQQAILVHLREPEAPKPEPEQMQLPEPEPEPIPVPEPPRPTLQTPPKPAPVPQQPEQQTPPATTQSPAAAEEPAELIASENPAAQSRPSGDKPAQSPHALPPAAAPHSMPAEPPAPPQEPALDKAALKALLADYAKNARARIVRQQKMPEEARRLGHSGSVKLKFVVNAAGNVDSVEVSESSGYSELDQQAISAVKGAAPFGSIPAELQRDSLPMTITLKYRVD